MRKNKIDKFNEYMIPTINSKNMAKMERGLRQCTGHSRESASTVPLYRLYALPPMRPCSTEEVPLDTMVCIVGSITKNK